MTPPEFVPFPKMARHSRRVIVSEKIDGTNAQVHITEAGEIFAGSRTKWITPTDDNYSFAKWVEIHRDELAALGPGSHFGEWWGSGIQRRYNQTEKRFSLFNVGRWGPLGEDHSKLPACCSLVPVLWDGNFNDLDTDALLAELASKGSVAAPGFMQPEGIVIFHLASRTGFKKTIEKDDEPKGAHK